VRRRRFLASPLLLLPRLAQADEYPPVVPGATLRFPRDHGSHPEFRIEWWYVTGWVRSDEGREYGVQVTFFRNRPRLAAESQQRFGVAGEVGRQELQCDGALQPRILGLVDDTHASAAQRFDDSVVRERLTNQGIPVGPEVDTVAVAAA